MAKLHWNMKSSLLYRSLDFKGKLDYKLLYESHSPTPNSQLPEDKNVKWQDFRYYILFNQLLQLFPTFWFCTKIHVLLFGTFIHFSRSFPLCEFDCGLFQVFPPICCSSLKVGHLIGWKTITITSVQNKRFNSWSWCHTSRVDSKKKERIELQLTVKKKKERRKDRFT